MHGARDKYCIYCGKKIPIDAKKCPYCLKWQEDEDDVSRNHFVNSYVSPEHELELKKQAELEELKRKEAIEARKKSKEIHTEDGYSDVLPIRRQLLLILVGGWFYSIWWYYKSNKLLEERFHLDIHSGWRTIGFIIPIVNWFMYYILLRDYERIIKAENFESYDSIYNTLIYIFIPVIGGIWTFCNVQESINRLWMIKEPNLPIRRSFTSGEKAFLLIIIAIIILIVVLIISVMSMALTAGF